MPTAGAPLRQAPHATFTSACVAPPCAPLGSASAMVSVELMRQIDTMSVLSGAVAARMQEQVVLAVLPRTLKHHSRTPA
jgi:hypothetical protein